MGTMSEGWPSWFLRADMQVSTKTRRKSNAGNLVSTKSRPKFSDGYLICTFWLMKLDDINLGVYKITN